MGKSVYDESPIKLIRKVLTSRSLGQVHFTGDQIRNWVRAEYPEVTEERFKTNLIILSTNDPKRLGHPVHLDPDNDFLVVVGPKAYRLFCPGKDKHPLKRSSPEAIKRARRLVGATLKVAAVI